jgi:hypothetical protein
MMDPVDTSFGSDQHGLVCGYRFSEGEPPRPIICDGVVHCAARRPIAAYWRNSFKDIG